MKITIVGTVLNVREGVSKKSGKPYRIADVYDGEELLKIFAAPSTVGVGERVELPCRLRMQENGGCFIMALN